MARIELLVTVKAYPAVSRKYGEVVCVAGIRTDTEEPEWVRLWPVPYRDMPFDQRFKKYDVIAVDAEPQASDPRPESLLPNIDSLAVGRNLKSTGNWKRRRPFVEPLAVDSMCAVRRQQELDGTSLAVCRPTDVDMRIEPDSDDWEHGAVLDQPSLFYPDKARLEKIPYRFKYEYRCAEAGCAGHSQSIVDWEIAAAFRSWRDRYGTQGTLDRIRTKWVDDMFAPERDSYFFVGNMHQHPTQFLVLGVYWPKRV